MSWSGNSFQYAGRDNRRQAFSDKVYMLPYLDQAPIYNATNFDDFPWNPWETGSNLPQSARLPVFNCPSNGNTNANGPNGEFSYAINVGVINYSKDNTTIISGGNSRHNGLACYTNWAGESDAPFVSQPARTEPRTRSLTPSSVTVPCDTNSTGRKTMQMHHWSEPGGVNPHRNIRLALSEQRSDTVNDCGRHNARGASWASSFVG